MNANAEKLAGLPDIGGIVVESIVSFLADPVVVTSINSVLALGVQAKAPEAPRQVNTNSFFSGKTVANRFTAEVTLFMTASDVLKRN